MQFFIDLSLIIFIYLIGVVFAIPSARFLNKNYRLIRGYEAFYSWALVFLTVVIYFISKCLDFFISHKEFFKWLINPFQKSENFNNLQKKLNKLVKYE